MLHLVEMLDGSLTVTSTVSKVADRLIFISITVSLSITFLKLLMISFYIMPSSLGYLMDIWLLSAILKGGKRERERERERKKVKT